MKLDLDALEAEISRATSEQDKKDLRAALEDLKLISTRQELDAVNSKVKNKFVQRKKLGLKIICSAILLAIFYWQISNLLGIWYSTHETGVLVFEKRFLAGLFTAFALFVVTYGVVGFIYHMCLGKIYIKRYKY